MQENNQGLNWKSKKNKKKKDKKKVIERRRTKTGWKNQMKLNVEGQDWKKKSRKG
jgi:hypothetical protein